MDKSELLKNEILKDKIKIFSLIIVTLIASYLYLTYNLNYKFLGFALGIRVPKLVAMLIVSIAIGISTISFQTTVSNEIVTPSLLGMNSLYMLFYTLLALIFGPYSSLFTNTNLTFILVLIIMGFASTVLYSYLLKKTENDILIILLIGTIISTFFGSLQSSIIRILEPNEYDALLRKIVPNFSNVNSSILVISAILIFLIIYTFRKELSYLDVLILGKNQSINLGVDYNIVTRNILIMVSILISISTALVGPLTFLGLITVNISRNFLFSYKSRETIFASIFIASILLITSELLIEHVFNYSFPISVIINIVGGFYFLYLLFKQRGRL